MTTAADAGRRGLRNGRSVERAEFPADVASVGLVRAFVRRALAGFPLVDDAELCASELAANAVRYGSECGDVFWLLVRRRCELAYVAVIDCGGATVPRLVDADEYDEGCRGLALVDAYANAWGAIPDRRGGYRVWFEVAAR